MPDERLSTASGTEPDRTVASVYAALLVFQAVMGLVWWLSLTVSADAREVFEILPGEAAVTDALLAADLVVIVGGSLLGAWATATGRRWAAPVVAFVAGGLAYVTLYLLVLVALTGEGTYSAVIMVPPTALSVLIARLLWRQR